MSKKNKENRNNNNNNTYDRYNYLIIYIFNFICFIVRIWIHLNLKFLLENIISPFKFYSKKIKIFIFEKI